MLTEWDIALTVAVVAGIYFVQYRLSNFVQPMRLILAREGEELLSDGRLPEPYRKIIGFQLDNAYSPWITLFATAMLPVFAICHAFGVRWVARDLPEIRDSDLRRRFERIDAMFVRSIICANLIGGLLFTAEMLTMIVIYAILGVPWKVLTGVKLNAMQAEMDAPWLDRLRHSH